MDRIVSGGGSVPRVTASGGTLVRPTLTSLATPQARSESTPPRAGRRITLAILAILAALNLLGLPYYVLPTAGRVRSPLHAWLKPTGYIGQTAGLLSLALFLFMWLYPLRKYVRGLSFTGSLARWLDVHVVAGLVIPLLAATHAAWHFTGIIGLGYGAMFVVSLSGIVGKYLYVRIPRGRSGLELGLEEVEAERQTLLRYIAATTGVAQETVAVLLTVDARPYSGLGPLRTLARMIGDDLARFRAARRLRRGLRGAMRRGPGVDRKVIALVLRLARRQMALTQQMRMLDATQRVFRYWHVAHRPVAITALLAVLIHVITAVALGVTWLR
jgi:hypothetical protein